MFNRGDQIIYIPHHAEGDKNHPDAERGFITSIRPGGRAAWCRFWIKGKPGELRTKANSESVDVADLIEENSVAQYVVDGLLEGERM